MAKVALYTRVSTQEQAINGLSLGVQLNDLKQWANQHHHEVVGIYSDEGISARKPASKRGALQRLLRDIENGGIDIIAFTKLDRWFRNVQEYYKVQEILEKYHVAWMTIHEDYETSTSSGRFKVNIMLAVAQDEADRTSERIKAVFASKREKLEYHGGSLPIGYTHEHKSVIIDQSTKEAVASFFNDYLETHDINSTIEKMQLHYQITLNHRQARKILMHPIYYGVYCGKENAIESYITKEAYDIIQTTLLQDTKTKHEKRRKYLFSGLLVCGECGYHYVGVVGGTSEYPINRYRCGHRINTKRCLNQKGISENKLESYLLTNLSSLYQGFIDEIHQEGYHEQKLQSIQAKIERSKKLYLDGLIEYDYLVDQLANYEKQIKRLSERLVLPELRIALKRLEEALSINYKQLSYEDKINYWRALIDEIRLYANGSIEVEFRK